MKGRKGRKWEKMEGMEKKEEKFVENPKRNDLRDRRNRVAEHYE